MIYEARRASDTRTILRSANDSHAKTTERTVFRFVQRTKNLIEPRADARSRVLRCQIYYRRVSRATWSVKCDISPNCVSAAWIETARVFNDNCFRSLLLFPTSGHLYFPIRLLLIVDCPPCFVSAVWSVSRANVFSSLSSKVDAVRFDSDRSKFTTRAHHGKMNASYDRDSSMRKVISFCNCTFRACRNYIAMDHLSPRLVESESCIILRAPGRTVVKFFIAFLF